MDSNGGVNRRHRPRCQGKPILTSFRQPSTYRHRAQRR